jgi:hypothetical protein
VQIGTAGLLQFFEQEKARADQEKAQDSSATPSAFSRVANLYG